LSAFSFCNENARRGTGFLLLCAADCAPGWLIAPYFALSALGILLAIAMGMAAHLTKPTRIANAIVIFRNQKVLLDADLAALYGVTTKALNQAVRRNKARFPRDFMFQLDAKEAAILRSQTVTSNGRGGRRNRPYAFTEQGVAMLSSVLRSARAIAVNIEIMRAFVRLRQIAESQNELAQKLGALEKKYDAQFKVVFDAIRALMTPTVSSSRRIGFR
jgi:ORF6N domain-containing protein